MEPCYEGAYCSTNAQALAYSHNVSDFVNIPEEVWPQFLDLPTRDGDTIFAYMCSTNKNFRLIPKKFISRERLTLGRSSGLLEKTALEQIVRAGLTGEVPWGNFSVSAWIRELDKLKDAANLYKIAFVAEESIQPLRDFIRKVEEREALSEVKGIEM
jgi:hypothetical protein